MDIDVVIRVSAIALAAMLLLSTIDFGSAWDKIKPVLSFSWLWKRTPKQPKVEIEVEEEPSFLEIVDLWHQLKVACDDYGLKEASSKLDEVFPLLNVEK